MVWLLLAFVPTSGPGSAVVEAAGVRICTQVRANVYTYELTNTGVAPITQFEVPYDDGYDFSVPTGWDHTSEDRVFRAWASAPQCAIRRGRTDRFSFRVTSKGAVLGHVPACVGTATGESLTLPNVWGAVAVPRSYILLVAGLVLALAVLHSALLTSGERRRRAESTAP